MSSDIYDVLLNPTRVRIIQTLSLNTQETITANEICAFLSDVPRTTLYRHINVLIEANILHIVAERKIRGSVERTLSLNIAELEKLSEAEDVPAVAFRFLMLTYAKFETYFKDKPNKSRASMPDTIFLRNTILMLNDKEFQSFLADLRDVFEAYTFEGPTEDRKPRDISFICAPPEQKEDDLA
ncbi:MAG: helix-turn-helix domain-containing protein [Oscillospiraceae bacterium]|nr:helix-turn-helix domain-containing protein [Oscillospiraceae bacterium]